jgi:hypothetical protein
MSGSVRREVHDPKYPRRSVSVSKWDRLLNAGAYGVFLAEGVGEGE